VISGSARGRLRVFRAATSLAALCASASETAPQASP
jgi:hypothetical protein